MILLPPDFREFLKLLNRNEVEYLVIGGYAVNYHGYPRATGDLDVWVSTEPDNTERLAGALWEFGFPQVSPSLFTQPGKVIRMGMPPLRIELLTSISGVEFAPCYQVRMIADFDGLAVNLIAFEDLKTNKRASGRLKDLADLDQLS